VLLFRNGNIFFFGDESMLRDISVFLFPRGPRISLRINPLNSSLALNQLCAFAAAACSVQKKVLLLVQVRKTPKSELTVV